MFQVTPEQLKRVAVSALESQVGIDLGELGVGKNLINAIKANIDNGLEADELQQRKNHFGSNNSPNLEVMSFWQAFCFTIKQIFCLFLILLSTFIFLIRCNEKNWEYTNEWIENIIIITLIWIYLIYYIFQEQKLPNQITLVRKRIKSGQQIQIVAQELVVGDIVVLVEGFELYADGLILESNNLYTDERNIQNVSFQTKAQMDLEETIIPSENVLFAGTKVISGSGKYIVICVGQHTAINSIKNQVEQDEHLGILQQKTQDIQHKINIFVFIGSFLFICLLIGRYLVIFPDVMAIIIFSNIWNFILVLLIANLSKALSLYTRIRLPQLIQLLLKDKNLEIRNIKSLEALPFMNTFVVDKTGTLTENKMTVELFWNDTTQEMNQMAFSKFPKDYQQIFVQCCLINNTCYQNSGDGSKLEKELYTLIQQWGGKCEDKVTFHIPFNSARRTITTILNYNRLVVRGEGTRILQASTHYYSLIEGKIDIDQNYKAKIENSLEQLYNEGRAIAIAYRDIDTSNMDLKSLVDKNEFELDKSNLTLLGFLVFLDPTKLSAIQAISVLKSAGIKVIMATGDNATIARQVAIKCQIFDEQSKLIEGCTFQQQCEAGNTEFMTEIDLISVVARARPEDKFILVKQLQQMNNVVGCCGDGTNDALAISKADIGFSLGIAGTEIARQSSDIILLDDDLQSIAYAVIIARNLMDSIKKFSQYQISTNFALLVILIASNCVGDTTISPLQFLWINFITECLATIALTNNCPQNNLQSNRAPKKNESLLNYLDLINIGIIIIYQTFVCLLLVDKPIMVFNTFVQVTLCNSVNARMTELELKVFKGFFSSWVIITSLFLIGLCQFIIIQYGGQIMSIQDGLTYQEWGICLGFGIGSIFWRFLIVLIIRPIVMNCHMLRSDGYQSNLKKKKD